MQGMECFIASPLYAASNPQGLFFYLFTRRSTMTNEEFVKALKLQQDAHNDNMRRMSEYYESALAEKQSQIDTLTLATIGDGGAVPD